MLNTNSTQGGNPRRVRTVRRIAIGITLLTAVPAAAAVVMQNFVRTDITTAAACMTKIAGADETSFPIAANAPYAAINTTQTGTTPAPDSVTLLNETVTMKGFLGDRTVVSDAIRVKNTCNYPIVVSLKAEPQFGAVASTGFTNVAVDVYLGLKNAGASGTDFTVAADWDPTALHYNSVGASSTSTGTVTIPVNEDRQIGYRLDIGTSATGTATLRYTVSGRA